MSLYPLSRPFRHPVKSHGSGWTPSSPAGLIFLSDPGVDAYQDTVGGTLCTNGTLCAAARDQSSGAHHLTAGSPEADPTFRATGLNGLPGLEFIGSPGNALGNTSFNITGLAGATGIIAAKFTDATGLQILFGWQGLLASSAAFVVYINGGFFQFSVLATGGSYTTIGVNAADTLLHVLSWRYDSATGFVSSKIDRADDVVNTPGPIGNIHDSVSGLALGYYPNLSVPASAIVGQQAMYGVALSDADWQKTHNAWLLKYGI